MTYASIHIAGDLEDIKEILDNIKCAGQYTIWSDDGYYEQGMVGHMGVVSYIDQMKKAAMLGVVR